MANHDLRTDNSGKDLICALLDAADRGIQVQLLVDGIWYRMMKWNPWMRAIASHPRIEVRIYNRVSFFCFWKSNYRMHDKYIIADDRLYLLGGRNANDLFLGDYSLEHNIDRDILVYETTPDKETSLKELQLYFDSIWKLPCSKAFKPKYFDNASREKAENLVIRYKKLKGRFDINPGRDWKKETWKAQRISLLSNLPHNGNKEPVLWNTLCCQMEKGKRIRIQTPYEYHYYV